MSSIASAEQVEEWPFGQRNVMPDYIEGVRYDYEEGSNCGDFKNQYPDVATYLTVLSGNVPTGFGPNYPSYGRVGGSMCGNTRGYMNIYPYSRYENWTYVVNGMAGFSPITCCECDTCYTGDCWPGTDARIQFKEGTHYISFLASTGGNLYIRLYDMKGSQYNLVYYEKIIGNTDRVNGEPSNFTQFSIHLPNIDIARMDIRGSFNGWHIDDLIIGGEPGYLPEERRDYSYAADMMKKILGANYLEFGAGYNIVFAEFYTADEIINNELPYWNPETKELLTGQGIYDVNAIVYAFNVNEDLVNWMDINKQAKHDFKVDVAYEDIQPGDVFFIDYPDDVTGQPDGCYDEVGMVIEPTSVDEFGNPENLIRIIPSAGVSLSSSAYINMLYGDSGFVDYKCLPDSPKGGHSPYPKIPTKMWI